MICDVLMVNSIGPGFTPESVRKEGIGGSELEIVQIAEALAARGHKVTIANGVTSAVEERGVRVIPYAQAAGIEARTLYVERMTMPPPGVRAGRAVVRATDVHCPEYAVHHATLEQGGAVLVGVSRWQVEQFAHAKYRTVIAPMLGETPQTGKVAGRFVYASAPLKGLEATLNAWRGLKSRHRSVLQKARLLIVTPGHFDFYRDRMPQLTDADKALGIKYQGSPTPEDYRKAIASAEGLFFVNTFTETFCCAAAFAERARTRTHILCLHGKGGIPEAIGNTSLLTEDPAEFERAFLEAWQSNENRERWYAATVQDRHPAALAPAWEQVLQLPAGRAPDIGGATQAPRYPGAGKEGLVVETYNVPPGPAVPPQQWADGGGAKRFWLHERVLVGGSILHEADGLHLQRDYNVTHVLSAESEHLDEGKGFAPNRARRTPFIDSGVAPNEATVHAALDFADEALRDQSAVLYTHCQLGGSRGPAWGYLVCVGVLGMEKEAALERLRRVHYAHANPHQSYLDAIDAGIASWKAAKDAPEPAAVTNPEALGFPAEHLPKNHEPMPAAFGADGHLARLRRAIQPGGSEYALGLQLFALVSSTRARTVIEIGRFKGFSTLAIAMGLQLADVGWQEPRGAEQRPDVDYGQHTGPCRRVLYSIDPHPLPEAEALVREAGLFEYVRWVNEPSEKAQLPGGVVADVAFIDGLHTYAGVRADYERYAPLVKMGGYLVFHDVFGWYKDGKNGSAIKRLVDEIGGEQLLVDTGYASLVILRKTPALAMMTQQPTPVPPRADGKPTLGAVIIARDENPIIARAISSVQKVVDAVTVIVDAQSNDGTREVAASMGAEVHVRPAPAKGGLASVRNDAMRIAEQRTEYMLLLDADDAYQGERPAELTLDSYNVTINDHGTLYPRPLILRSRRGFRFVGCDRGCDWEVKHEYVEGIGTPAGHCKELTYNRIGATKGVSGWQDQQNARAKYMRHARALHHHHIDHPECARTVFYLAQSFRDAGMPHEARDWYKKRVAMPGGYDQERYYAQLQVAEISQNLGEDPVAAYLAAYDICPARAEPLRKLAEYYRDDKRRQFELAYTFASRACQMPVPEGAIFLDPEVYSWRCWEELGLAAHYTRRKAEAIAVAERLQGIVPAWARPWAADFLARARAGI